MAWQDKLQLGCADATEQQKAWAEIKRLHVDCILLAMLAADEPQFYDPMKVILAKAVRDRVLKTAAAEPEESEPQRRNDVR